MKKRMTLAMPIAMAAAVSAQPAFAAPPNQGVAYGPTEAELGALQRAGGKDIAGYFNKFGAPYAQYNVGDKLVYRWGHGVTTTSSGGAHIVRDELLVTADKLGHVSDVTYKRKYEGDASIPMIGAGEAK